MANPKTEAGEIISETAKAEGGPTKGSLSAQMQSQLDKQENAANDGNANSNKSEAGQIISEVAKAEGGTTKGSKSAQLQSELTKQQNASGSNQANNNTANSNKSEVGRIISEVAHAEGGTTKGSASAQLQSEFTKQQQNANTGNQNSSNATNSSKSEAGRIISQVAQVEGGTTKGSASAKMQSEITKAQQQGVDPTSALTDGINNVNINQPRVDTPQTAAQPVVDKEKNFEDAAQAISNKIENDPSSVTKEDAGHIHSREQRAHGTTEKGGISSVTHKLADQNEAK